MPLFPPQKIFEIVQNALDIDLQNQRDELVSFLNRTVRQNLPVGGNAPDQLRKDVIALNGYDEQIADGSLPLENWLRVASYSSSLYPAKQEYFRATADEAMKAAAPKPVVDDRAAQTVAVANTVASTVPQKVLFVSDLLPVDFLAGAVRTSRSVAKITVPRYENGKAQHDPGAELPIEYVGTCWLLGRRHVLTNHHVVNARSPGEGMASLGDLDAQSSASRIEFDFDSEFKQTIKATVTQLVASDAQLDYALLKLDDDLGRDPLPISIEPIVYNASGFLPVNIIQHPGGRAKQIAIRNNLAARIEEDELAYFTDTLGGSSGSPVCNDGWQVLALHRASTSKLGTFTYQGKDTAWVNIGTPLRRIVEDLKAKSLWDGVGATLDKA